MSSVPAVADVLPQEVEVLDLPSVAELLSVPITKVHQLLKDGQLIALRRNRVIAIPALFFTDEREVLKGLPGSITVLRDAGFSDTEVLRWLFAEDPTLPGSPIDALRTNRGTEVRRRAQALAF